MTNPPPRCNRLVGIFGGAASGKDTVAGIFESKGYAHVSSSDLVRAEIASRGQVTSRELQTHVANELRESSGVGYWMELSLGKVAFNANNIIISGIYSPGEGRYLTTAHSGILVGVTTGIDDSSLRFERLQKRSDRTRDSLTFNEFIAADARENSGTQEHETNISQLMQMAHFVIHNTADFEYLQQQTEVVINMIEETEV